MPSRWFSYPAWVRISLPSGRGEGKRLGTARLQQCLLCSGRDPKDRVIPPSMLQAPLKGILPCPRRPEVQPTRLPHCLLSAGLSPRALAISLKEGRSLGFGAQQRCISRYSLDGQPSGCGSRAFPACKSVEHTEGSVSPRV